MTHLKQQYSINLAQHHAENSIFDNYFHLNADYTYNHTSLKAFIQQNSAFKKSNIHWISSNFPKIYPSLCI